MVDFDTSKNEAFIHSSHEGKWCYNLDVRFKCSLSLESFDIHRTIGNTYSGTGSFSRVKLVRLRDAPNLPPFALKAMRKQSIIRTHQLEHIRNEKTLMTQISNPFITKL